jgi:hypothetical protein
MPRISAFYGIVITIYFSDHPPPHFHARYADHVAEIAIDALEPIRRLATSARTFGSFLNRPPSTRTSCGPTGTAPAPTICRHSRQWSQRDSNP